MMKQEQQQQAGNVMTTRALPEDVLAPIMCNRLSQPVARRPPAALRRRHLPQLLGSQRRRVLLPRALHSVWQRRPLVPVHRLRMVRRHGARPLQWPHLATQLRGQPGNRMVCCLPCLHGQSHNSFSTRVLTLYSTPLCVLTLQRLHCQLCSSLP